MAGSVTGPTAKLGSPVMPGICLGYMIYTKYISPVKAKCFSDYNPVRDTASKFEFLFIGVWALYDIGPSKNKPFAQHLYNVEPTSATLFQHCINVVQMFCVYWAITFV